ncbi:MAG TPA: DUF6600 domain-containing protein [Candidatus Aquilonibacter sp.]|nr:DUF6600 domain-containing protein [Candidatus Aquilonibacter sp.]
MREKFLSSLSVLILLATAALGSVAAQTTEETPAPSDQPSAPMEMGQPAPPQQPAPPPGQMPPNQPQAGQPPQSMPEAQPGGPSGEGPAEVKQGVGHISFIHGDVSTQRGDSGTSSAAILNQPVLMGDKISTGPNARAEVQLDYANILRLGPNAQANIANFTNSYIQIQLAQGMADYAVFNESEAEPEIDTPNVSVHPAHQDVVVRVEVRPDGDSVVIVRKGEVQISTPKGIADVKQGQMATVRGQVQDAQYKIASAPGTDDWDIWNSERDHMIHTAKAWQHTSPYYTGAEDLDANGNWENVPDYGQIWVPNEPDGWTPYRDGNWVWEPYYGWTWVGYEPWGWAPYHYGRWMWYGGAWGWWPGPVWGPGFYRPFWSPAYVSFFGFGGGFGFGFGVGFGWGGFGWLPLGPCDWFHPWWGGYGGRFGYVGAARFGEYGRFGGIAPLHAGTRFSNVAHISDAHIGGALSTVHAGQFGAGRVTAGAATREQISSARMMTGNLPVVPSRASLSASGRAAAPSTIHNGAAQHFAGTQTAARPASFQQETARLQQSMQQNHISSVTAGARTSEAMESRSASTGAGKPSAGTPAGGRESGAAGRSSAATDGYRGSSSASSTNRSGWQSFHGSAGAASSQRGESGSYWNRTSPSSNYSRGSGSTYSRPQLSMRQPIAQPRSYGGGSYRGYGGFSSGVRNEPSYGGHGYGGASSYGGSRGGYSSPNYGGSRGGYSGASHSAPSNSHSSGGHSGGGAHSGGGGHR